MAMSSFVADPNHVCVARWMSGAGEVPHCWHWSGHPMPSYDAAERFCCHCGRFGIAKPATPGTPGHGLLYRRAGTDANMAEWVA